MIKISSPLVAGYLLGAILGGILILVALFHDWHSRKKRLEIKEAKT